MKSEKLNSTEHVSDDNDSSEGEVTRKTYQQKAAERKYYQGSDVCKIDQTS